MVVKKYGFTNEWKKEFVSTEAANNGSMGLLRLGKMLTVQEETDPKRQHVDIISPCWWVEKLYAYKNHKKLALQQWKTLNNIDIALKFEKHTKLIRHLYMTFDKSMRNITNRHKKGGCGFVHQCPKTECQEVGCYKHLELLKSSKDVCKSLKYVFECHCNYGFNRENKICLRSSFQGVIASYLCLSGSQIKLSMNTMKYMKEQ